jgi:hypothetical protein
LNEPLNPTIYKWTDIIVDIADPLHGLKLDELINPTRFVAVLQALSEG